MGNIEIKFDSNKEMAKFLKSGLEKYNFSKNKYMNPKIYENDKIHFGYYCYYDNKLIGGAYGWTDNYNWVWLDLLYIDENYRNYDIGTNLMNKVEEFARENNCIGIRTETWSFQARGFYEKMGFVLYGEIENHPIGAIDYSLKKVLIKDESDFPEPIE